MGKTWVLDTETKGTGANVVPLERAGSPRPEAPGRTGRRPPKARRRPPPPPAPRPPARFRVVDVVSGGTMVEDGDARDTVAALGRVRSVVDVRVYACDHEGGEWRLLSLADQQLLWSHRPGPQAGAAR